MTHVFNYCELAIITSMMAKLFTHDHRYICVDLKRFRHDGQNADMMQRMMGGKKIDTLIDFPLDALDFSEVCAAKRLRNATCTTLYANCNSTCPEEHACVPHELRILTGPTGIYLRF